MLPPTLRIIVALNNIGASIFDRQDYTSAHEALALTNDMVSEVKQQRAIHMLCSMVSCYKTPVSTQALSIHLNDDNESEEAVVFSTVLYYLGLAVHYRAKANPKKTAQDKAMALRLRRYLSFRQ